MLPLNGVTNLLFARNAKQIYERKNKLPSVRFRGYIHLELRAAVFDEDAMLNGAGGDTATALILFTYILYVFLPSLLRHFGTRCTRGPIHTCTLAGEPIIIPHVPWHVGRAVQCRFPHRLLDGC